MKRIYKLKTYIAILTVALLSSCIPFDEVDPDNEFPGDEVGTSTRNIELVINQAYLTWARAYCESHIPLSNIVADHTSGSLDGEGMGRFLDIFEFTRFEFKLDNLWIEAYKSIDLANNVLQFTSGDEPIDNLYATQRDRMRGEAYYLRAFNNFLLIRYYGTQYTESNKGLPGIILRTSPATGFNSGTRSTVEETYNAIISDLDLAISFLPLQFSNADHGDFPGYRNRANRMAAVALKAKVLYQMNNLGGAYNEISRLIGGTRGELTKTELWARESLSLQDTSNILNVFTNGSGDNINDVRNNAVAYTLSEPHLLMRDIDLIVQASIEETGIYLNKGFIDKFVSELATDDSVRLLGYIKPLITAGNEKLDTAYAFNKFLLDGGSNTNWPIIRLEELILMRAEFFALDGSASAAIDDINLIRASRGADLISTSLTLEQAIEAVGLERMLELVGEGERFFTWKRMGAYNAEISNVYPASLYATYDREDAKDISWDGPNTLLRIPDSEIDRNPDLSQSDQNP